MRPLWEQRTLALCAACLGTGTAIGIVIERYAIAAASLMVLAAAFAFRREKGKWMACFTACAAIGLLLGGIAAHPAIPEGGTVQMTGIAAQDFVLREDGTAAGYLEHVTAQRAGETLSLSRVYWTFTAETETLPMEGEQITCQTKLYQPSGQMNPYGFDFKLYLMQRGTLLGASGAKGLTMLDHPGRGIASFLYQTRKMLSEKLDALFGEQSALPQALLLGVRDNLPEETQTSYRKAGIAHLLAVSGLHVGLLAGALLFLTRWLSLRLRTVVLGVFLLLYCGLLEFSPPVVRASLLLLISQGHLILRKPQDGLTTLSAAFILILLFDPLAITTASFQLSFCAVLGMALWGPKLRRLLRGKLPGLGTTLSATLGSMLPTAQWFHSFSPIGLLINPFLCALFGVLLPLYAAALALSFCWPVAGQWLAQNLNAVSRWLDTGITFLSQLPGAWLRVPSLPDYVLAAIAAALIIASGLFVFPKRKILAGALVAVSLAVWGVTLPRNVRYIQLAAGQADCALLLDRGETWIVDAGEDGGDLAAYLLATGRQADKVFITHLHSDHFLGLEKLLKNEISIGEVYLPVGAENAEISSQCADLLALLREKDIPVIPLFAGDKITGERIAAKVLWPLESEISAEQNPNQSAMALLLSLDGITVLNGSDLDTAAEQRFAQPADILKVSHHGSAKSTAATYLNAVQPTAAFITDSPTSSTLPAASVLERLEAAGIPVYRTSRTGAVTVEIQNDRTVIYTYK